MHAAAAFNRDGEVLLTREDVGRHNAVDKVVGALLLAGELPARGDGLFVSGRASVEMVQKAWAAGFGSLVAVSAPTALAVHAARRAGLTSSASSAATRSTSTPEPTPVLAADIGPNGQIRSDRT